MAKSLLLKEQQQKDLSKPPIPELRITLERYLASLKPILPGSQFEQTQKTVAEFLKKDGEGDHLQQLLHEFASSLQNWVTYLWIDDMYLSNPLPLPVNSSPFCLFARQNFASNLDMFRFAAKIISFCFQFKLKIDNSALDPDYGTSLTKNQFYCMNTYQNFFKACRVPGLDKDQLFVNNSKDNHIIVASNNQVNIDQEKIIEDKLIEHLNLIWFVSHESKDDSAPIGLLTTENRRTWASLRNHLLHNTINQESLRNLETSRFIVCLDDSVFVKSKCFRKNSIQCARMDISFMAHQLIHGGGQEYNSGNRYYDKFLQIVIGKDGICGIIFEHSASEGVTVIRFCDELLDYLDYCSSNTTCPSIKNNKSAQSVNHTPSLLSQNIAKLNWKIDGHIKESLKEAGRKINRLVEDLDLFDFYFQAFGKQFIKDEKLSPDAFVQIALQLTYYKVHRRLTSSYESCSLRRFKNGRVDNIRANSSEVLTWVKAVCDDDPEIAITEDKKLELFMKAINKQVEITKYTLEGHGPDNHLLGLKEMAKRNNRDIPLLFKEKAYKEFLNFKLSTSQLAYKNILLLGYGPVVQDGYGCAYRINDVTISFCITSFYSAPETSSAYFASSLEGSLLQLREICLKIKNS